MAKNIKKLLEMEDAVVAEARGLEDSDNSDAVKNALRAVGKAISTLRNAIKTKSDLERE